MTVSVNNKYFKDCFKKITTNGDLVDKMKTLMLEMPVKSLKDYFIFILKLKMDLPQGPSIAFLDICSREIKTYS